MVVPQFHCFVLDHFSANPGITPSNATSHSLSLDLCQGSGTNSWPHFEDLVLLNFVIIFCFLSFILFVVQQSFLLTLMILPSTRLIFYAHLLFTGLDRVLSQLEQVEQKPSRTVARLGDTSGNESAMGEPRWRLRYKMKKTWGTSDIGLFL